MKELSTQVQSCLERFLQNQTNTQANKQNSNVSNFSLGRGNELVHTKESEVVRSYSWSSLYKHPRLSWIKEVSRLKFVKDTTH